MRGGNRLDQDPSLSRVPIGTGGLLASACLDARQKDKFAKVKVLISASLAHAIASFWWDMTFSARTSTAAFGEMTLAEKSSLNTNRHL